MPRYRLSFVNGQPDDLVDADEVRRTSTSVEFVADVTVMNRLRTVVVRRLAAAEVADVVRVGPAAPLARTPVAAAPAGAAALVADRAALPDPEWAEALVPCAEGRLCPSRLELISVVEALRAELQVALGRLAAAGPPPGGGRTTGGRSGV